MNKKMEAARALLARQKARESLLAFALAVDIPGAPVSDNPDEWMFNSVETGLAKHHRLMLSKIEDVMTGKLKRLMLFLPPGSAKSSYASVVAPAWLMGRMPGSKVLLTTYGSDLARKHGRRARQLCRSDKFYGIFGTEVAQDTSAVDMWALDNGSEYMGGGLLSGITGTRAHGLIVDDPVKGREEADSEVMRNKVWDAYLEDARTRLIPGGWEIIVQTRWHEDDLAGRILPEDYDGETDLIRCQDGRDWYVICVPALCEKEPDPVGRNVGEYLWPEWFTPDHFEGFKSQARTWNALFQQRPQPDKGTFFQKDWFQWYDPTQPPEHLHKYMSTDFAVTEGKGDSTELGMIGVDPNENLYVLDWWSGQSTADVWIDALLDMVARHQPFAVFGESGPIRRAIEPFLTRRMQERGVYCWVAWLPRTADKATSARGIQARCAQGKIFLPDNQMGRDVLDQLIRFPAGRHDDKVDVMALFGLALDQAHPAIVPVKTAKKNLSEKLWDRWTMTGQDQELALFGVYPDNDEQDDFDTGILFDTVS